MLRVLSMPDHLSEFFVMGDDDKLKVLLPFPVLHYSVHGAQILPKNKLTGKLKNHSKMNQCKELRLAYRTSAAARLSAFGPSRFVVGSSRAKIPQLRQKVSANASLMISEARTYTQEGDIYIVLPQAVLDNRETWKQN